MDFVRLGAPGVLVTMDFMLGISIVNPSSTEKLFTGSSEKCGEGASIAFGRVSGVATCQTDPFSKLSSLSFEYRKPVRPAAGFPIIFASSYKKSAPLSPAPVWQEKI
jgi:hypothetical protein